MDPSVHGGYPQSMRTLDGDRLPEFTREQSEVLKGSFDFVGINYYAGNYVQEAPPNESPSYITDAQATITGERRGVPIGPEVKKKLMVYSEVQVVCFVGNPQAMPSMRKIKHNETMEPSMQIYVPLSVAGTKDMTAMPDERFLY